QTVAEDVAWLANEISTAPALSLLDPSFEAWTRQDADLLLYTDACGQSEDKVGGGGFWWTDPLDPLEIRHGVYFRGAAPFVDTNFAETATAALGVEYLVSLFPGKRRILIFTDNTAAIYAIDAGKSSAKILSCVADLYSFLRARSVDVRVKHVSGVDNTDADELSRLTPSSLAKRWRHDRRRTLTLLSPSAAALEGAYQ
ncbi:hypothetical protein JCM10213_003400, partial [Rhodosporidiobolus nylandii]